MACRAASHRCCEGGLVNGAGGGRVGARIDPPACAWGLLCAQAPPSPYKPPGASRGMMRADSERGRCFPIQAPRRKPGDDAGGFKMWPGFFGWMPQYPPACAWGLLWAPLGLLRPLVGVGEADHELLSQGSGIAAQGLAGHVRTFATFKLRKCRPIDAGESLDITEAQPLLFASDLQRSTHRLHSPSFSDEDSCPSPQGIKLPGNGRTDCAEPPRLRSVENSASAQPLDFSHIFSLRRHTP